jgi:hypothetical protein
MQILIAHWDISRTWKQFSCVKVFTVALTCTTLFFETKEGAFKFPSWHKPPNPRFSWRCEINRVKVYWGHPRWKDAEDPPSAARCHRSFQNDKTRLNPDNAKLKFTHGRIWPFCNSRGAQTGLQRSILGSARVSYWYHKCITQVSIESACWKLPWTPCDWLWYSDRLYLRLIKLVPWRVNCTVNNFINPIHYALARAGCRFQTKV